VPSFDARGAGKGRLADVVGTGEILLVFEAEDPTVGRRELAALLANIQSGAVDARKSAEGAARADPGEVPKGPPAPTTPAPPATPAEPAAKEALKRPASERLHRLKPVATYAELKRLAESVQPKRKGEAGSGAAPDDADRLRLRDAPTVSWRLDAATWKRLETLLGDATWDAGKLPGRDKDAEDEVVETEEADEVAEGRSKKKPDGKVAKGRAGKRSGLGGAAAPQPVRVRILIVPPK
jgi:hypothetical protein